MNEYLESKEVEMKTALIDAMSDPRHFKRVMDVYYSIAGYIEELVDRIGDLTILLEEKAKEVEEVEES